MNAPIRIPTTAAADVQQAFRDIQAAFLSFPIANLDFKGQRIVNAGRAVQAFDYVTKRDLDVAIGRVASASATAAETPDLEYGTHDARTGIAPNARPDGALFVETDRAEAIYQVQQISGGAAWVLLSAHMRGSAAGRPGDLGTNDAYFYFYQDDFLNGCVIWRWSGAVWHYVLGMLRGTLSAIPAAAAELEGALYNATDFDRVYQCTGSAWQDAPGQPSRGMIALFNQTTNPPGWHTCDGTTVTISTATGGTTTTALPNLIGKFLRGNSATGGTGGSDTQSSTVTGNTGTASSIIVRQAGSGANQNQVDPAATFPITSQPVAPWDNRPAYADMVPMMRL